MGEGHSSAEHVDPHGQVGWLGIRSLSVLEAVAQGRDSGDEILVTYYELIKYVNILGIRVINGKGVRMMETEN